MQYSLKPQLIHLLPIPRTNKGLVSRVDQLQRQIQYQTPGFGSDQLPAASATNVNSSSSSYKRRDSFSKYVKGYHQHNHNNQQQHQHINIGSSPVISSATSLFSPMQVQQQYHQQPAAAAAAAVDLRLSTTRREVEGIRSYFTEEDMQEFSDETRQILFGN